MSSQLDPERNTAVLRMWREGASSGDISTALRLSRGAVIGIVDRARKRGEDATRTEGAGAKTGRPPREPRPPAGRSVAIRDAPRAGRSGQPEGRPFNARGTVLAPSAVPTGTEHTIVLGEPGAVGRRVATLALRNGQCRFPVGDTRSPEFRYCCARIAQGSYCGPHARLCFRSGEV